MMNQHEIRNMTSPLQFILAVQDYRGGHKTQQYRDILTQIFNNATMCLREFTLTKKLMGTKNILWVSLQDEDYQERFCSWFADKHWKATKNELDLWFADNPGRPTQ